MNVEAQETGRYAHGCEEGSVASSLADLDEREVSEVLQRIPGGAANVQMIHPLSPLQEGLLFHKMLNVSGDTYILSTLIELQAATAIDGLVAAIQKVVERHDALRTVVLWEQLRRPVQVVCRRAVVPVRELRLDSTRDARAQMNELMRPHSSDIDLRRAALLLSLAPAGVDNRWYALLQVHHIICDHLSLQTIVAEALSILGDGGRSLPAPACYSDYVAEAIGEARAAEAGAEAFFRDKLHGIDATTAPFGLLDVHADGGHITETRVRLDAQLAQRIYEQTRRLGTTPARLFHALWGLVVGATSACEDVVYGTIMLTSGRKQLGAQPLVALSVNTLPLCLRLRDVTAIELLEHTHRELGELIKHQHAPLTLSQRCSGLPAGAPLFTTLFNYRRSSLEQQPEQVDAGPVRILARGEAWSSYPLALTIDDRNGDFLLTVQADRRIRASRIIGYLEVAAASLLDALECAPQTPALALSVIPEDERRLLVETFNATQRPALRDALVHELVAEQANKRPSALAVICGPRQLTYDQLNRRANQLAHYLRAQGVGPETRVALLLERDLELVICLLAVLKAGGAYVPLDVSYPAERLAHMLRNSRPVVTLTQSQLQGKLPPWAPSLLIDVNENALGAAPDGNQGAPHGSPSQLAYVIYTSGSTGMPKGVMVEHGSLANMVRWTRDEFDITEHSACSALAAVGFDAFTWETWPALTAGATLHVAPAELAADPEQLLAWWTGQPLDVSFLPTPMAELAFSRDARNVTLRTLLVGGDRLRHRPAHESFALINNYGPTESTVLATSGRISAQDPLLHIGRPIANTCIYILNGQRALAPLGAVGEIYIGGAAVARGYLDQPDLTAQRFIRDPFSTQPHARMYQTGDLGRWHEDGTIEYLGRNDQQVKIRGFRIELGDIEAQLAKLEQVRDAVVVARDVAGQQRLIAYLVPTPSACALSVESLRERLGAVLPDYMIPSAFVTMEQLPLTTNGKLDRRALPEPPPDAYAARGYEAPRGEVEQILASIWETLLGLERVGRHDNFFELGGHSLLIVQMMERLRRAGLGVEMRQVFERTTLHELATALGSEELEQHEIPPNAIPARCQAITPQMLPLVDLEQQHIQRIVAAVPGGTDNIQDIYPLAPLQEGILFHYLMSDQSADAYVIATLLTVASRSRLDELLAALQGVIDRHGILRTALLWEDLPRPVQVVYRTAKLPVEEVALDAGLDIDQQLEEWLRPTQQRLEIRRAPLMRVRTAAMGQSGRWYVLLQLHHLVADNSSLDIMISEAISRLEGRAQRLPEAIPYRMHVAQVIAQEKGAAAEAFFSSKLGDVAEPTAPFGLLDIHGDGSRVEEVREELPAQLARSVRDEARRFGVSAATVFHAAWALVAAATSGRDDVVFGTVLLGRLHGSAGAQRILGMFINTLPLRVQLRDLTAKELIEQTQRELVDLLLHEHTSLSVAQRCSGVSGSSPLFTSLLNYRHNVPRAQWSSADGIGVVTTRSRTNYPITMSVDDLGDGFAVVAQADCGIGASRVAAHLQYALQALLVALREKQQVHVRELDLLPPVERREVLDVFNDTVVAYPRNKLISQLFEEQAARAPARVALIHGDATLTYAQLNDRANRLAHYLREQGVGPDKLVGICIERSIDMVVALLGVLKAGGAYLPLDPHYPRERLAYMLDDAAPAVVLTHGSLAGVLPATDAHVIWVDTDWTRIARCAADDPAQDALGMHPENLIYVIYTSGSTGRPKGTAMPHRAMVNLIEWHRSVFASAPARVLQFAALSFDVAFQDTFSTLCTGGTLVLLDEWVRRDVRALVELLRTHAIERMFVPPLMLQSLAEFCSSFDIALPALRDVIAAGEQLRVTPEIVGLASRGCRLHNHYGPTETHVVTALTLSGDPATWPVLPTIGRPIANTRIYILDRALRAVPRGVIGEIYIGGAGVARGYLRRPELTEARFLADPFLADADARMYKTGDLGRWRQDGTIEYLGRNDDQVKVRGFRIELGEIEARLVLHKDVKEAAVVAREDVRGEKRLVAYFTQRHGSAVMAEELRASLASALPEHMVPGAFVALDRMPLTPSGKLDRRALPAPDLGAYASKGFEAPQGEIERTVARVFRELLNVESVGRDDDFFDLGGHSLLAMQVAARVQKALRVEMPISLLFECPTVRQLAPRLEELRRAWLFEQTDAESAELEDLLATVAAMPESEVQKLVRQLTQRGP